jgi:cyclopropane fatty-acyl-phospholipid synthase-like methyltransferase
MNADASTAVYTPQVFDVRDVEEARRIILTPEAGTTTDTRWERETPWLADRIVACFALTEAHVVIDFGCGLGRMAKALIERTGCWVVGVDMSRSMRQLAPGYVESPRFAAVSPPLLDLMIGRGFRAELAIAIWVLQHVARPDDDVTRLDRVLVPGGGIFVANNLRRAVPTDRGWAHDGVDVDAVLARKFAPGWRGALPTEIGGDTLPAASFIAAYTKPPAMA